ncbi:hypothetical protein [Flavobacterium anhuiense]|uniref:hypothetical protein n=1 Tax=Flavobacterium anhuiense TaxID=459526 RepID=UPI002025D064|nr:hypothetical protein [Flavobacterium anhuiense]URM37570.1 hypothetical protein LLY39_03085 [Flavobacterium anhuiense]
MTQKTVFHPVESKEVPYLQLWITATIISFFIVAIIFMVLMTFFSNFVISLSSDKILLFIVLQIMLFNTLICEGRKYYLKRSEKEYNKVYIDNNGITFLNSHNQTVIAKILWKNIQPRANEKFDIDFSINSLNKEYKFYFFWNLKENSTSKIPSWSPNKFMFMFAKFPNKADLLKTFFTGIIFFRPDIKTNPEIYSFYRLNPISLEVDRQGIKKENKVMLLIILFSIIMSSIIVFLIYVFSL